MSVISEGLQAVPQMPMQQLFPVSTHSPAKPAEPVAQENSPRADDVSKKDVEKIISDINSQLQAMHTELNFSIDKETERMVLKIVNRETDEVIRQIPAEEALRIASRLSKLLGLIVDHTV